MKTIPSAMASHIAQEVTTLCMCWKVIRTDGTIFGFTDLDMDIIYNGVLYESETGFNRSAISSNSSFDIDNLDVNGFLESDRITEQELRAGLFDFASVYVFMLNWQNPTDGEIKLRRGWFGEVTQGQNGMFSTEIRGLNQALNYNIMETFQPDCRADFCDARCTLNIADFERTSTVASVVSRLQFTASSLPIVDSSPSTSVGAHRYWAIQMVAVPTGPLQGGFAEIKFWDQSNNEVTGGSSSATSHKSGHPAGDARDGKSSTEWVTNPADNAANTAIWQIDFGSAKDIKSVQMMAALDPANTPTQFVLQYSDDGISFNSAKGCQTTWSVAGEVAVWTIGSGHATPDYQSTAPPAVPPPATGASSYIGGRITFTSGPNAGRVMEIIDFNDTTGEVTVFEAFPYEISVGDRFTITQGCDKMFATCQSYNNEKNFRGEPDVPGQDSLFNYPDAH